MTSPITPHKPLPEATQRTNVLSTLTWPSIAVVTVLVALVASLLNPIFKPTFVELLGRTLLIGIVLLLAYKAAGVWRQTVMPRWDMQITVVILAAPCATMVVYLVTLRGDTAAFAQSMPSSAGVSQPDCLPEGGHATTASTRHDAWQRGNPGALVPGVDVDAHARPVAIQS